MNNKLLVILLVSALVLLLVLAGVLYGYLGQGGAQNLMTLLPAQTTAPTETTQTEESEETVPTETTPIPEETQAHDIKAPDFTVYDRDGNPVKLSDFLGIPVVMNCWASWCGPCKMEMPEFQEFYACYEGEIAFLMINMADGAYETVETATAFLDDQNYTFPVYFDTGHEVSLIYGVNSLPTTFFIDSQGNAVAMAVGAIGAATLQEGIGMIHPNA